MSAQSTLSPPRSPGSNLTDAIERPASPEPLELSAAEVDTDSLLSSPAGSSSSSSVGFIEMSDLMLPASALESELFGVPQDSGATVVSTASYDETVPSEVVTSAPNLKPKQRKASSSSERRHSLPSTLTLSSEHGDAVAHPVPEFLCHLFSMLREPSHAGLISWVVPSSDEPDNQGGGVAHKGKIVVHEPESLQDLVLGKYYRHSKYASFQRQLNYFGFKKRLHGGKKGKLSPCSYIHDLLTEDVQSLFGLKRRPPSKKRRMSSEADDASVASREDSTSSRKSKKRRGTGEKKSKKNKGKSKKEKEQRKQRKNDSADAPVPQQVEAEEYGPPSLHIVAAIENNQFQVQPDSETPTAPTTTSTSTLTTAMDNLMKPAQQVISQPHTANKPPTSSPPSPIAPPAAQPTLLELLSTTLPPSDVLFDDTVGSESMDDDGVPAWVTNDGQYHYHNVDSSLVDLAMLY